MKLSVQRFCYLIMQQLAQFSLGLDKGQHNQIIINYRRYRVKAVRKVEKGCSFGGLMDG